MYLMVAREPQAAVAASADQRKSFASRHVRCRTVASLGATATRAFCIPLRLATASPETFSEDHRTRGPVSITSAALDWDCPVSVDG